MALSDYLDGKTVAVTGAAGSVGSAFIDCVLNNNDATVRAIDHSEDGVFSLHQHFGAQPNMTSVLADIRDQNRMTEIASGVDIIFHCAALKHVLTCEHSPNDAIATNVVGVQNIIRAALHNKVPVLVLTSTDKAVNPTNVMGTSKLMSERLITAANNYSSGITTFCSTRFGNVLGSRGSVYRVFKKQIKKGGPISLTSPEMTRFIMTANEAIHLIMSAGKLSLGGEVFVPKMRCIRMDDFAHAMIEFYAPKYGFSPADIPIDIIGPRPGEKMWEDLMTREECDRSLELDNFYAILPEDGSMLRKINYEYSGGSQKTASDVVRCSHDGPFMSHDEIVALLREDMGDDGPFDMTL
ncbi:MAG: polysaccharide biosynthesis protein [Planctomycetaceae bacterium]|jgi:FlaA1/EpsC-like NDP-sugar epimerase|nr:polysaccharide biosynthesis protein [Rhodospirillales bacterium]MBT4844492.1 polysaccharide biosynthesis protein [Planctomycetaceae bacterium]MBT4039734.1 polysaccharide biosynthesis protein [Rhodospirillales bacterium]MBT4626149.1 polysaccharide biosynthesis protein [Rhodospirillales bacterium]MBT5350251.1 polysaccharide biosynthesis protein [Rhodospirillales bacterium]